jgi:hypothetical protein
MDWSVVAGVLWVLGVSFGMAAVFGAVLYAPKVLAFAKGTGRRLHVVPPAPPTPMGRPIERIAADARRLRVQLGQIQPGLPVARLAGWRQAYDDVLLEGCRALGIEDRLSDLPPGTEREAERLRVEYLLEAAGLRLDNAS